MIEPHPINHWSFPLSRQIAGSVPLSSVHSLITRFSVYQAGLALCTFSSKAAIDCTMGKQNQAIFRELSANYNTVNSLMVSICLAHVTAERETLSALPGQAGELVHITSAGWTQSHLTKGKLWALLQQGHTLVTERLTAKDYTVCVASLHTSNKNTR